MLIFSFLYIGLNDLFFKISKQSQDVVNYVTPPLLVVSGNIKVFHTAILKSKISKRKMDFFLVLKLFPTNF